MGVAACRVAFKGTERYSVEVKSSCLPGAAESLNSASTIFASLLFVCYPPSAAWHPSSLSDALPYGIAVSMSRC